MSRRAPSPRTQSGWAGSPERATLLALYAEADALVAGWTCACSATAGTPEPQPRCCHFAMTGREPYPTAVELEEIRHAMRSGGVTLPALAVRARPPRALPLADERRCPLLSDRGTCRIYASRPLGCRTFFCDGAEAPFGARARLPREALGAIGRRIADLSARFDPRAPHPRPLVRALRPDDRENRRF